MEITSHNPDRYMSDLRQIIAQGRKRIGILLGAGAPASILFDKKTDKISSSGEPLIPTINGLTVFVLNNLDVSQKEIINKILEDIGKDSNIEKILSHIRSLSGIIGCNHIYNCDGAFFSTLSDSICVKIGEVVSAQLPKDSNPYTELASWIGGAIRSNPIEIFTPNYDLLMEESLEIIGIPYFDGFSGGFEPFFDPVSISNNDDLPSRWARLWKLHGSLGWAVNERSGVIIRGKGRDSTELIYPDHRKYDLIQKQPYTALFDHLRHFLSKPDTLLLSCGFSFNDAHITAVIDEALAANPAGSLFAFQFGSLDKEPAACKLARKRSNMSVYASDGAVINCIEALWVPGVPLKTDWHYIRNTYWGKCINSKDTKDSFLLGNFSTFAYFLAQTHAEYTETPDHTVEEEKE